MKQLDEQWEFDTTPVLLRLMATLQSARLAAPMGRSTMTSATDQIGAGLRDGEQWLSNNPSPSEDLDEKLRRTLRTFRIVARLFEVESGDRRGPNLRVIDREIDDLVSTIANTFAADSSRLIL